MNTRQEDAHLILRLYELRREEKMRQARDWFTTDFNPQSAQDLVDVLYSEHSAMYRMVSTYWDMAAAFVNHGAIDEQLFNDLHNEHVAVYARIEPYLAEFRAVTGMPRYLLNLEQLILRMPDCQERLAAIRRFMKRRMDVRARTANAARSTESAAREINEASS